ncbi:hypothetical protein C4J81_14340 [Deltaproteobacteria bacterium Smac51]|nr:hypothetical protein C4J81_14340 [Deltaproteobacteria bacterium Smac51]
MQINGSTTANTENMYVKGRSTSSGGMSIDNSDSAQTGGSAGRKGVYSNFKESLMNRLEHSQRSGLASGSSQEDAQALVDSITATVAKVKDTFGQEAGNAAMSKILKDLDQKGFSLESVTETVSDAVRHASQSGTSRQKAEFYEELNEDLGANLEEGKSDKTKSLSRAINDFFGLEGETNEKGDKAKVMGFDEKGNWREVDVEIEKEGESGQLFLEGTPEAAEDALRGSSSFTLKDIGQDTVDDMVDFLRNDMGSEEAASYVESQSKHADFMNTVDMAINKALENSPDRAADVAKLEQYLNGDVKMAINNSSKINSNLFGNVEFEGWTINSGVSSEEGGQAEVTFSTKWKYGNRDDVSYVRDNRVKAKAEETEAKESSDESPLMRQFKKLAGGEDSGNLIDDQV